MAQVKIGPNFFAKVRKDYADWTFATAREFVQNSADAKYTTRITVEVTAKDDSVLLVVENNGETMSEDIIVNKLLALGESGKDFAGTVGGFGIAKSLLYMSNLSYRISSGKHLVVGCGGDYELTELDTPVAGTRSEVFIAPTKWLDAAALAERIIKRFVAVIATTQRPNIEFTVNGKPVDANLKKGARRRGFTWGTAYTNKTYPKTLVVRIDGMPMFTKQIDLPRCVILELEGNSGDSLTSNRDGLQYTQQCQLDNLLYELAVDKVSALREPTTSYTHYSGKRLAAKKAQQTFSEILTAAYATVQEPEDTANEDEVEQAATAVIERPTLEHRTNVLESWEVSEEGEHTGTMLLAATRYGEPTEHEVKRHFVPLKTRPEVPGEFIIKNELGMQIPEHLLPESFSAYAKKLITSWTATLLEMHHLFADTTDFAVGFILSDDREAEYEADGPYGAAFYINPVAVKKNSFGGRSLARRWKFNPIGKHAILSVALHEYNHRKSTNYHDEEYANSLTDLTGVVFKNLAKFHKCFRG